MKSTITTEDCKNFIQSEIALTDMKKLKRVSKYKGADETTVREFSHPDLSDPIYIVEDKSSQLTLSLTKPSPDKPKKEVISIFSETDIKGINVLVKETIKKLDKHETDMDDEFIEHFKKSPYWHALPSQFTFNFPLDAYENTTENVTNGIDSPFILSFDSFCIRFYDKNKSEQDIYLSNLLTLTGILSEAFDFDDEYHVGLDCRNDEYKHLTVKDIYLMLIEKGFDYSPKANAYIEDDCLFKNELSKLNKK